MLVHVEYLDYVRVLGEGELAVPALGISRYRLDLRLRDLVDAVGGEVRERSRVTRQPREGQVWSAGRPPAGGPWIGLKMHVRGLSMQSDLEMHLGTGGYVGLAGVGDGVVNVCGLFRVDRSLRGSGDGLMRCYLEQTGITRLAERLVSCDVDHRSFSAVAGFRFGRQERLPGACVVGDAESMIPPFTGNGMSMALQAAEGALEPLTGWSRGDVRWDRCCQMIAGNLTRMFRR